MAQVETKQKVASGGSGVVIIRYPKEYTLTIGSGLTSTTAAVGTDKVTAAYTKVQTILVLEYKMAHYAFLDENNMVTEVLTGKDETDTSQNWEYYYGSKRGQTCKNEHLTTQKIIHT